MISGFLFKGFRNLRIINEIEFKNPVQNLAKRKEG